jgi:hypothetical protein
MSNFVIAIPTYNRIHEVTNKTLTTLKEGGIHKKRIFLFVANKEQATLYEESVPPHLYGEIIIGKKGITNQRIFISNYFSEGQYVISMDDDVEAVEKLTGDKLTKIRNLNDFFTDAYKIMKKEHLFIWGIYPVHNPFFMYKEITFDLRFIIGVTFGFITRHNKKLKMSIKAETKEDYEQTILYYKMDGGVIRFNGVTVKTKFNAPGGLGTDRFQRNKNAAEYLVSTYPDMVTRHDRKDGTPEVKLTKLHRVIE